MSTLIRESSVRPAVSASVEVRAAFIRRTYAHLALAIGAFAALEAALLNTPAIVKPVMGFVQGGQMNWLLILGGFIAIGWLARSMAASAATLPMQYLGLGLYVFAEALIFLPLLAIAKFVVKDPSLLPTAAVLTGGLFIGLTAIVFITRTDFSFLRGILVVGGMVALALIIGGALFGFTLGLAFSCFMVALASGAILYDTSKILRDFPPDWHVAAALELFASVALLFWYVLRILMHFSRR